MSQIIISKDRSFQSIPGVIITDSGITIQKNAHLTETVTIKVLDRTLEKFDVTVEESASAKVILSIDDHVEGSADYYINFAAKANANLKFLLISNIQTEKSVVHLKGNLYRDANINFMASFVSHKIDAVIHLDLVEPGASLKVRTITISAKDNVQNLDVHMIHHAPHTTAEMTNIAIAGENGIVRLNGVGEVLKGMVDSSAFQTLRGIITNDKAQIDVNPILIIDEYDIQAAGHAATVGKLEEETLYYLMSRGLTLEEATKLIINGFLRPVIDEIDDEVIKENVINLVNERI
ncbi:SufD family Fe-S cluster assembly protein [Acholeplasma hippikon]|uniref:SufB-like domain-containing protein n=1 Tax=Acholeplasma hippikon TaxID=264636 RepID=A0A449BL25_9MOLU|nr:SufD family Fe-S cluster assembly protein [Acholeplasma hippikon]VEU83175.1 SufB-like domain-containing protein [Acholeplasma hippikon]